ncbi:esterase FE4-like [Aricia agestis]|uniref:esterase FE4-like n=1 Tax=Aricia agestis TaxID=91739 RepID=UPI001C20A1D8|nr:esterase FE4-like [Aricia agestis]
MLQVILAIACLSVVSSEEFLDVNIKQGTVRGYKSDGVFKFYGIPYATAPAGTDKYKAPLPPPTWQEVFEATKRHIACPQPNLRFFKTKLIFKDDCLIANVHVPDTDRRNLPVVVYIHGGAFQIGYGDRDTPNTLVKNNEIIAVTFNYRLGPYGFLCLGTTDVPGNAAMKDQVALLRWVQENIASFGGDPKSVTIAGCSAGGSSVDLHMVSKMSRGLFHRAIAGSGACTATFSLQTDPIGNAKFYAKLLGFDTKHSNDTNDAERLSAFYKNTSLSALSSVVVMGKPDASVAFTPCIEKNVGQEMFLDSYPFTSGDYRPVPMLFGFTSMEGMLRMFFFRKYENLMNRNFSYFLPDNLAFESTEERQEVADRLKHFYFGNRTIDMNTAENYINYYTDRLFTHSITKSIKMHVAAGNKEVYFYEYLFSDESVPYSNFESIRGASHCSQSFAVLDDVNENGMSQEYKRMKAVMRELWSNFIITGKPVHENSKLPYWAPVGESGVPFMSLSSQLELKWYRSDQDRMDLWDSIYAKHFRKPVAPHS